MLCQAITYKKIQTALALEDTLKKNLTSISLQCILIRKCPLAGFSHLSVGTHCLILRTGSEIPLMAANIASFLSQATCKHGQNSLLISCVICHFWLNTPFWFFTLTKWSYILNLNRGCRSEVRPPIATGIDRKYRCSDKSWA